MQCGHGIEWPIGADDSLLPRGGGGGHSEGPGWAGPRGVGVARLAADATLPRTRASPKTRAQDP